jgi:ammonia channel protein AmtB
MAFQLMFAIITGLITGAFAEHMKFSAMVLFMMLWATLVYDPLAHWVWVRGLVAVKIPAVWSSRFCRWHLWCISARGLSTRGCLGPE